MSGGGFSKNVEPKLIQVFYGPWTQPKPAPPVMLRNVGVFFGLYCVGLCCHQRK